MLLQLWVVLGSLMYRCFLFQVLGLIASIGFRQRKSFHSSLLHSVRLVIISDFPLRYIVLCRPLLLLPLMYPTKVVSSKSAFLFPYPENCSCLLLMAFSSIGFYSDRTCWCCGRCMKCVHLSEVSHFNSPISFFVLEHWASMFLMHKRETASHNNAKL